MSIQDVLHSIAEGRLHEALVRCWLTFHRDYPAFRAAEKTALEVREDYAVSKKRLERLILENLKLKIENRSIDFPLALIEVLDRYLFERYNRKGNAPPVRIDIDGDMYHIHRRVIAYVDPPRHTRQTGHLQSWVKYHWILPCNIGGYRGADQTGFKSSYPPEHSA